MISAAQVGVALGGLGLLLLGMGLLTSGLRMAAGRGLNRLLARWTSTRLRGFLTGTLLTGLVQSSAAVTVTTIGFANAGLLNLSQAAWVIFGNNVGTTVTGWLVAMIGLRLRIEALALPLIGVGILLRMLRNGRRLGAVGEAVAGFGVLFLGLAFLRDALGSVGEAVDLSVLEGPEVWRLLAGIGLGALITTLMMSSSAALAIILATASQGLVSVTLGAALVVGANLGTTTSALLASVGAAPNAKRVTALHVVFNLITAVAASILLRGILALIHLGRDELGRGADAAVELAIFHTSFNVLGVLLMIPLSGPIVRYLERRFISSDEDLARPRHIDRTVLGVPHVALEALRLESRRAATIAAGIARDAARSGHPDLAGRSTALRRLIVTMGELAKELGRGALPEDVARSIPQLLRAHARMLAVTSLAQDIARTRSELEALDLRITPDLDPTFLARALAVLAAAGSEGEIDIGRSSEARSELEAARDAERARLLRASMAGDLSVEATALLLQLYQLVRRLVEQTAKAAASIEAIPRETEPKGPGPQGEAPVDGASAHEDAAPPVP